MRLASGPRPATLTAVRTRHVPGLVAVGTTLLIGLGCPAAKGPQTHALSAGSSGTASGTSDAGAPASTKRLEKPPVASASASGTNKGIEPDPDDASLVYMAPPPPSEGRCGAGKTNPNGTCDCPPGFGSVGKPGDARCVARTTSAGASAEASGSTSSKPSGTGTIGRCPRGSEICE